MQPPYQPPYQPPPSQQPFQQPPQQPGYQQSGYQQPGQPQPFAQPPAPPGLVAPLGPPARVAPELRTSALVLLGVALVGLAVFGGYETALMNANRLEALLWFLPAIIALLAMTAVWQDTVLALRCDGRVLQGTGLLGKQGVDLTRLTAVTSAVAARSVSLQLRDDVGGLSFDVRHLVKAGPAAFDVVGRAVWEGQQQRRYVIPVGAAGAWGMPTLPGAPANGKSGATRKALGIVALLVVGITVGVVLGY